MKSLIILLTGFGISLVVIRLVSGIWQLPPAGCIGMSMMLIFTAVGHFAFSNGMALMLPPSMPFKKALIYITGLIEIAAAIGLLLISLRQLTGWLLALFFILILPANISAALRNVNYQKATYNGHGQLYLWFRIPLQLFFIAWVYWFAVKG